MTRNEGIGAHQHERLKGNRAPGMLADGNCESVTAALHPGAPLCITGKPWQQFTAFSPLIIDVSVRPTVGHPPQFAIPRFPQHLRWQLLEVLLILPS